MRRVVGSSQSTSDFGHPCWRSSSHPILASAGEVGDAYSNGRGERSQASANPLVGDLDPASLPRPLPRDYGRRQATAALSALCVTP